MDDDFALLNDNEVLHVTRGRILMSNPTFRVNEFLDALAQLISEQEVEWTEDSEGWFSQGLDCEALRLSNQGWQRGRVRIRLEFSPAPGPKLLPEGPSRREERFRDDPRRRPIRDEVYSRGDDPRDEGYPRNDGPYPDPYRGY